MQRRNLNKVSGGGGWMVVRRQNSRERAFKLNWPHAMRCHSLGVNVTITSVHEREIGNGEKVVDWTNE
jgi:hypothetical protein